MVVFIQFLYFLELKWYGRTLQIIETSKIWEKLSFLVDSSLRSDGLSLHGTQMRGGDGDVASTMIPRTFPDFSPSTWR